MNKQRCTVFGWALVSAALCLSTYANYKCSFGCGGVYGQVLNPLSIIGALLYLAGTALLIPAMISSEKDKHSVVISQKRGR